MKTTLKTIFLFFTAAVMLTACSDDDKNPPTAGFSLSDLEPVQWDVVAIASNPTAADEVVYAVSGGAYEMDGNSSIQFLEANEYTVTQTVTNADGTDATSLTVQVEVPQNTYKMSFYGNEELSLAGDAYWFSSMGALQIRIEGFGATAQETNNLVKVNPVAGADPIYGTGTRSYSWSGDGEVDTYSSAFTHYPATGDSWDAAWFTSTSGNGLEITLVYDAETDADDVYDIKMMDTTLNEFYDSSFSLVDGEGVVVVSYRGKITPLSE